MDILPTFLEQSFKFKSGTPEHIEAYPGIATYVGLFSLFGAVDGVKPYPLAVDVVNEELARELAKARKRQQEATIEIYGYTDDIYILHPNGKTERTYYGGSS